MITIKDVAKLAGVSKATVSRTLNNSGYVSPETRKKIEDIVKQNNYLPSAVAANLSRQETMVVGVVVPEIRNVFYADIVHGITQIADEKNLSLMLFDTQNDLKREERVLRVLQQQRVRGIILGPSVDYANSQEGRAFVKQLRDMDVPIVVVDRGFENMQWDAVLYENYQSSYQAAIELYKAGNRRMAVITGDMDLQIARERLAGFRQGVEDCGLKLQDCDILYGNFLLDRAYDLSRELLSGRTLPDAVYTSNNQTTLGFLKAANELGIRIGEDIALIGNDRIAIAEILGVKLSCVYRDNYEMGRMAVRLLETRIENPEHPRNICMIPYQVSLQGSERKK